jgi:hypothetical protein
VPSEDVRPLKRELNTVLARQFSGKTRRYSLCDGKFTVVANSNSFADDQLKRRQTLTVIDTAKIRQGQESVLGTLAAGVFPREFGRSVNGHTLFVANYNSDELEMIDLMRLPVALSKAGQ